MTVLAPRHTHIWAPAPRDFYVEPRWCSERLFEAEPFIGRITDPACGTGRIVEAARAGGHCAFGRDLADGHDFLLETRQVASIVSNPPYGIFREFAEHALQLAKYKVALIFPLARVVAAHWLRNTPLARIYLLTPRPSMPPGHVILRGEKPQGGRADFCWLIWSRGFNGNPELRWLHRNGGDDGRPRRNQRAPDHQEMATQTRRTLHRKVATKVQNTAVLTAVAKTEAQPRDRDREIPRGDDRETRINRSVGSNQTQSGQQP